MAGVYWLRHWSPRLFLKTSKIHLKVHINKFDWLRLSKSNLEYANSTRRRRIKTFVEKRKFEGRDNQSIDILQSITEKPRNWAKDRYRNIKIRNGSNQRDQDQLRIIDIIKTKWNRYRGPVPKLSPNKLPRKIKIKWTLQSEKRACIQATRNNCLLHPRRVRDSGQWPPHQVYKNQHKI